MRKSWLVALVLVCLVGCHRGTGGTHGVVCCIKVESQGRTAVYTAQDKMSMILNELRQMGQQTLATINPDTLSGESYQITLERTDGKTTVYQTKGEWLLRRNQGPWKQIETNSLSGLYVLLKSLPPDE